MKNLITYERSLFESFMNEGVMSDIHQLANEVKSEKEFILKFFKDYGNKIKRTKESEEWLKSLYLDMSESKVNEFGPMAGSRNRSFDSSELVDRIGDLDDILINNRKSEREWEETSQKYLTGEKGFEYWADLDDQEVQDAIDDAEFLMKKYRIKESVVNEAAYEKASRNELAQYIINLSIELKNAKANSDKKEIKFLEKDIAEVKAALDKMKNESVVNEAKFDKKKLMKAMKQDDGMIQLGNGQEYIIYAYDNGNDDNDAMWGDKTIFALDQDGGEHEVKYSDIVSYNESAVNEAKSQIKRKYGQYKAINVYEKASIRNGVLRFVGKRFVTEEELKMQLTRISEDRGKSIDQRKWLQRNMKYFESTTNRGQNVLSLSKYGSRVFERILKLDSDKNKLSINESIGLFKTSLLNEARDINDPVLMALRANKHDREKKLAMAIQKKRPLYGKERTKAQYKLLDISQELKDLYDERANLYSDMENEAGQKGDKWSDDDANRYGGELNDVESKIEELMIKRSKLELKLAI